MLLLLLLRLGSASGGVGEAERSPAAVAATKVVFGVPILQVSPMQDRSGAEDKKDI